MTKARCWRRTIAMKILHDQNVKLNKTVYLIAGTDEESGMEGIDYYLKNGGPIPAMGFTPDADFPVIYGEKGNIHMLLEKRCAHDYFFHDSRRASEYRHSATRLPF